MADPSAGQMGSADFVALNGNTAQKLRLALYIGQFKAPAPASGTLSVPFNSAGTSINVDNLIPRDGNSGAPQDINGITVTSPAGFGSTSVAAPVESGATVIRNITYTPNANYIGPDSFQYTVTNPNGAVAATISVTVQPPPAPTLTSNPFPVATAFNTTLTSSFPVSAVAGAVVDVTTGATTAGGTIGRPGGLTSLAFTYTPPLNYSGPDSFTYTVRYRSGAGGATSTITGTVNVTVGPPGAPAAANSSATTAFQTPITVNLAPLITGHIPGVTTIVLSASPTARGGTLALAGTNATYTPAAGFFSGPTDSFTYTVQNPPNPATSTGTITITVSPPGAPGVAARTLAVPFNTAGTIDLASAITGPVASIAIATGPTKGTATVSGLTVTFTPNPGASGADSFTYTATAPGGATSAPATVTISIGVPPVPTAGAVTMDVPLNTATTLDLAPFIAGPGVTGIAIASAPARGTATVSGTRVTYTPRTDFFGADTFTYTAFGLGGASSPGTVTVRIVGRPDPSQQANVVGTVNAQIQSAQRFAQAQIGNFARRLEALHRGARGVGARAGGAGALAQASPSALDPFADGSAETIDTPRNAFASDRPHEGRPARNRAESHAPRAAGSADPFARKGPAAQAPMIDWLAPADPRASDPRALARVAAADMSGTSDVNEGPLRAQAGLVGDLISLVSMRSFNLAAAGAGAGHVDHAPTRFGGLDFWIEGSLDFGHNGPAPNGGRFEFETKGLSFGVDRRFGDSLVLGAGLGFARDRTDIGEDGSKTVAQGVAAAVYGSYQPRRGIFVDALIGGGTLEFETDRLVAPLGAFARSDRDGYQIFGSLAAGLELQRGSILLTPYARVDASYSKLKEASERGVGAFGLHYFGQSVRNLQAGVGLRLESTHATSFGWMSPRARIEARHNFDDDGTARLAYADLLGGSRFAIATGASERNTVVAGIGGDFHFRNGLSLGIDYQMQKSFPEGSAQGVRVRLVQALDGKGLRRPASLVEDDAGGGPPHHHSSDIRVDAGWTYDDNVTRGRLESEQRHDTSVNLAANKVFTIPLGTNSRLLVIGTVGVERFHSYRGLDRLFGGVRAEAQYRTSADFDAPTLALFGRVLGERYESRIRRGVRASVGVSARQAITDRILLFAAAAHNERFAESDVFDLRDNSLQLNLDYALSQRSTIYLGGEYRRGDFNSSGAGSLGNIDLAKVFTLDDAFPSTPPTFAYKVEGRTGIFTLGYNVSFGPRDSLDISWRRVRSTPESRPDLPGAGPWRYIVDQFSLLYLVRF